MAAKILFREIERVVDSLDFTSISSERRLVLQPLTDFIQSKLTSRQPIQLNMICTHNSRRSHLSQVWAQTAAEYYRIDNVFCYSGGTETTALFPMIAETLQNSGFKIHTVSHGDNPAYGVKYCDNAHPIIAFSKKHDDPFNPTSGFAAILTCSQADADCPFIPGAEKRIPIPFEDPKISDGTPHQKEIYRERSLQIATEMFYVFSLIKK